MTHNLIWLRLLNRQEMRPMNWSQTNKARDIYFEVAELPAGDRTEALNRLCGDDLSLRAAVEDLLAEPDGLKEFLQNPPLENLSRKCGLEGTTLGAWRLERLVAQGGMSALYAATRDDGLYAQQVAVKVIHRFIADREAGRRFSREIKILASLEHPGIVRMLSGGVTDDGLCFIVMEFVEAANILEHCRSSDLGIEARVRIFIEVCRAVAFAHHNLVVHRDLKPDNVLVTAPGGVKLLDFGIAKLLVAADSEDTLTKSGALPFTLAYASPELIRGDPAISIAADIFSLGVMLCELLTGNRPFQGTSPPMLMQAILQQEPQIASSLNRELAAIVRKALQKEPGARYASVEALVDDLERHLAGRPVMARESSVAYRVVKFLQRNSFSVIAVTAVVVAAALGTWQLYKANQLAEQRLEAVRDLADTMIRDVESKMSSGRDSVVAKVILRERSAGYLRKLAHEFPQHLELNRRFLVSLLYHGDTLSSNDGPSIGDGGKARLVFKEALELADRLWRANPNERTEIENLAHALNYLGKSQMDTGDLESATTSFVRAVSVQEGLYAQARTTGRQPEVMPYSLGHLGMCVALKGKVSDALAHHRRALEIREAFLVSQKDFWDRLKAHRSLSISLRHLAKSQHLLGLHEEVIAVATRGIAAEANFLNKQPDNAVARQFTGDFRMLIAESRLAMGQPQEALADAQAGVLLNRTVSDAEPQNAYFLTALAQSLEVLGRVQEANHARPEAVAAFAESEGIASEILKRDQANSVVSQIRDLAGAGVARCSF